MKIGNKVKAKVFRPYNGHYLTIQGEIVAISEDKKVITVSDYFNRIIDFLDTDFGKTIFVQDDKEVNIMKHQSVISSQRVVNMKNGITESQKFMEIFTNKLSQQIENNQINQEDLLKELDEISMVLDWVKAQ